MTTAEMQRINERLGKLRARFEATRLRDVADGYDPSFIDRCSNCDQYIAQGPFAQLFVAAVSLHLSLEDPTGCPEESVSSVFKMIDDLCIILETFEE